MRLLHTSDWHLGQMLHHFERRYEHQCFLDWLLQTLEEQRIDALLLAGDIFDNANPSAASQQQFYTFLTQARQRIPHLNTVIIAGNHDSPARLEAPKPFMQLFEVSVMGQVPWLDSEQIDWDSLIIPLKDKQGQIQAWCLAVPFLRPADLPKLAGDTSYAKGVKALYQQLTERAISLRQPGQALIALGHCHVSGGKASEDSERRIVIGGSEALPVNLFADELAYVALGHLHLAQTLGGQTTRRYCGSPLPLSFAETNYPHQVLIIELTGEQVASVETVRVPRFVELLRVPATPAPLEAVYAALQTLPDCEDDTDGLANAPYLEVRVKLHEPEPALRKQVESRLQGKAVRLAKIELSTPQQQPSDCLASSMTLDQLDKLDPMVLLENLYQQQYKVELPNDLQLAFAELMQVSIMDPQS
ncbi:MAG: exonuclease SbcCD subunit D [Proteobacteria bacterium]|nr:MAG: exonuclease SbcCD subunit D [Pseudomonadota bacterium]